MSKTANVTVDINGEQAKARLKEIGEEMKRLKVLKDKFLAEGNASGVDIVNKEMKILKNESTKVSKAVYDVNDVLKNISSASIRELQTALRVATRDLNLMKRTDAGFDDQKSKVKSLKTELDKAVEGTKKHQTTVQSFFSSVTMSAAIAIGAVVQIGQYISKMYDSYREQEKAIQKVEQAIKSTGGAAGLSLKTLTAEATKLQNNTLFGDEEILNKSTAQLLTFTNIVGDTFLAAQKGAMDLSTVLDGDLQNASIMLGKALNEPVKGLTALRRVGVSFTLEQQEQIKVLSQTNKLQEAQAIILGEVSRQYGGQAEAVAKGSGVWTQVKNQLGEVTEAMGGRLANATSALGENMRDLFKSIAEGIGSSSITDAFDKQVDSVINLTTKISPLIDRYDELKSKSKLSSDEQAELKKIIGQVSDVVPGAISAIDSYGNALSLNTTKAREFIKEQVAMMGVMNKDAIENTSKALKELAGPLDGAKKALDYMLKTGNIDVQAGLNVNTRKASQEEIKAAKDKYSKLANEQLGYQTLLKKLNGDALQEALKQREQDAKSVKQNEDKKAGYKKLSAEQLKNLANEEDQLAIDEIERRKQVKDSHTAVKTATEKLEERINSLKKTQLDYIKTGDKRIDQITKEIIEGEKLLKLYKDTQEVLNSGIDLKDAIPIIASKGFGKTPVVSKPEFAKKVDKGSLDLLVKAGDKKEAESSIGQAENKDAVASRQQKADDLKNIELSAATTLNDTIFNVVQERQQRELDSKLSNLEKQRDAELSNKHLTEKQKIAIEDKYAKKIAAAKLEGWKKQRNADAVSTAISTILAVMKVGGPTTPQGIITAIAGAAGVAEILMKKPPEFSTGGFTKKDLSDATPAGIVHANEFVGSSAAVANPSVKKVFDLIDYAQRNGTISQIDLGALVASTTYKGKQSGGYTTDVTQAPGATASHPMALQPPVSPDMINAMNRFSDTVDKLQKEGIPGKWNLFDLEKIQDQKSTIESSTTM